MIGTTFLLVLFSIFRCCCWQFISRVKLLVSKRRRRMRNRYPNIYTISIVGLKGRRKGKKKARKKPPKLYVCMCLGVCVRER